MINLIDTVNNFMLSLVPGSNYIHSVQKKNLNNFWEIKVSIFGPEDSKTKFSKMNSEHNL